MDQQASASAATDESVDEIFLPCLSIQHDWHVDVKNPAKAQPFWLSLRPYGNSYQWYVHIPALPEISGLVLFLDLAAYSYR